MLRQSLVFEGALHLCFAVSERASEIPSVRTTSSFSFVSFSLSTELLEDKQGFKLGGVDTSPSYLLFQTLLPLFWTLTCMIRMELTWTDAVFSRIAMVLFMCRNKSSRNDLKLHRTYFWKILKILEEESTSGGPHPVHEGGGAPAPLGAPPASWALWSSTDLNSNSIYSCSGRKNKGEGFIAFYDTEPPPSPKLSWEG